MKHKFSVSLSLALVLAMLVTSLAVADDISNNLDATIDASLESISLTVGGGNGTVGLYVEPTGTGPSPEDGKSGCNLTGSTTLVVSVNSSNTAVATVSPTSITFGSCGDTPSLTITPVSAGTADISLSLVSNSTPGSFDLAPASFTVNVTAPQPSDITPPSISYVLNPASPDGSNGWYVSDVTLTWTVDEPESLGSLVKTGCVDQFITADQDATDYSCSATSDGGSAGPVTVSIKRDATNPDVALVGGPADGSSHYFGFVPDEPTCTASDATSGIDGDCTVSGYSALVGSHTVTASAMDMAGNSASASASYEVLAWTLNGFYRPVEMDGVWNTVKGGSTVPLKFNVFAGATELTDVSVVKSFTAVKVACEVGGDEDPVDFTTTGGTSLRYDWTDGQFIQNWKTPKSTGCYRVTMTTQDLSTIIAFFKLK